MRPVKVENSNLVYRGPSDDVGDLHCRRETPGVIESVWELDDAERAAIAAGDSIVLTIYSEPIPPVAMRLEELGAEGYRKIGDQEFRVPAIEPKTNGGAGHG